MQILAFKPQQSRPTPRPMTSTRILYNVNFYSLSNQAHNLHIYVPIHPSRTRSKKLTICRKPSQPQPWQPPKQKLLHARAHTRN